MVSLRRKSATRWSSRTHCFPRARSTCACATTRYGFPGAIAASALMFTLNGTPLIYNGMEVGDATQSSDPALFEPQKIFWGAERWHPEYPKFYALMSALRREHA